MNLSRIKRSVKNRSMRYINERRGWTTNRKIVVIESDDWGSIRMPDLRTYLLTLQKGIRVDNCHYCKFDSLASIDDFEALSDVLLKHRDINERHPIITANTIVANPDFNKIKEGNYEQYHYELFTETLKRYERCNFDVWKNAINEKIFYPQLHGREHLNIERWLKALQNNSEEALFAFENRFFGISKHISNENNPSFMAALDYDNEDGRKFAFDAIKEAPGLFKSIFNYKSKSFIGPNYTWDESIEELLVESDVQILQGTFTNKMPSKERRFNYTGKMSKYNQIYTTRNVMFEPSEFKNINFLDNALQQIHKSFNLKKPAIISSHRVNYIGSIFEKNRTHNLILLDEMLKQILKRWPDVEFMHSAELGETIKQDIL